MIPGIANPQALNRYSYVFNNPTGTTDPTGHGGPVNNVVADWDYGYSEDPDSSYSSPGNAEPSGEQAHALMCDFQYEKVVGLDPLIAQGYSFKNSVGQTWQNNTYVDSIAKAVDVRTGADSECVLDSTTNPLRYHQEAFVANGVVDGSVPSNIPDDYTYFLHSHSQHEDQTIEIALEQKGYGYIAFPGSDYDGADIVLYAHNGDLVSDPEESFSSNERTPYRYY